MKTERVVQAVILMLLVAAAIVFFEAARSADFSPDDTCKNIASQVVPCS